MHSNNWNYADKFKELVTVSGGKTEGEYVITPGCLIVSRSQISSEASFLFDYVNIDQAAPGYERFAEFNYHLPHMNFPQSPRTGEEFVNKGNHDYPHKAFKHMTVGFLLAGISLETSLEIAGQPGAEVTKVISSDTPAMNNPFYRIQGSPAEITEFKNYLSRVVNPSSFNLSTEFKNMMLPACKATIIVLTMSLCKYDALFQQMKENHGTEFNEILALMCDKLSTSYPLAIKPTKEYK